MSRLWLKNNKIVVNALKQPILCGECPCISGCNFNGHVFEDVFNEFSNTNLDAHIPDIDVEGGGWNYADASNAWIVNGTGDQLNGTPSVTSSRPAWIEAGGNGNAQVSCKAFSGSGGAGGIVFRYSDDSNWLRVNFARVDSTSGTLSVEKYESGSLSTLVSTTVDSPNSEASAMLVEACDDGIVVYYRGTLELNTTSSFNITATKFGVSQKSYFCLFDDFRVLIDL